MKRTIWIPFMALVVPILVLSLDGCLLHSNEALREQSRPHLNQWLGKTKDERIRKVGIPTKCVTLTSGEEICEWAAHGISGDSGTGGIGYSSYVRSWEHRVWFTYTPAGIATTWRYRGAWGEMSSDDPPPQPNRAED